MPLIALDKVGNTISAAIDLPGVELRKLPHIDIRIKETEQVFPDSEYVFPEAVQSTFLDWLSRNDVFNRPFTPIFAERRTELEAFFDKPYPWSAWPLL